MKKIILSLVLFIAITTTIKAQVLFNTAQTLKGGGWCIGINPAYADRGDGDFALFFHGGYGLGKRSDVGLDLGFGWSETYFGLNYEKTVLAGKPSVSIGAGMHYWRWVGLDFTALVTFPINNLRITTGMDMNLVFGRDANDELEMWFPIYLPISFEVLVKKNIGIVFEGNILINDDHGRYWRYYHGFTSVGGGINIYF